MVIVMFKDYVRKGSVIEITLENDKVVKVSSKYIDNMITNLEIDEEEAILTWLEDEEYIINEDQEELNNKAKDNKVLASLHRTKGENVEKTAVKRVRTAKENPTKEMIISKVAEAVAALGVTDLTIENKAKLITFKYNNEEFKIDLVQKLVFI